MQKIVEEIEKLRKNEYVIELHQISTHMSIIENELANNITKKATRQKLENKKKRDQKIGHQFYLNVNSTCKKACFGKGNNFEEKKVQISRKIGRKKNLRLKVI